MGIVITLLIYILEGLSICLIARILLSWLDPQNRLGVGRFLRDMTEPIVVPVRAMLPPLRFVDLSVMVVMLLLQVICYLAGGLT
jgi:YggT family protein